VDVVGPELGDGLVVERHLVASVVLVHAFQHDVQRIVVALAHGLQIGDPFRAMAVEVGTRREIVLRVDVDDDPARRRFLDQEIQDVEIGGMGAARIVPGRPGPVADRRVAAGDQVIQDGDHLVDVGQVPSPAEQGAGRHRDAAGRVEGAVGLAGEDAAQEAEILALPAAEVGAVAVLARVDRAVAAVRAPGHVERAGGGAREISPGVAEGGAGLAAEFAAVALL
jgi:hypothetical protein